ncbi:hypothetical protein V6N12_035538 [Hibiscus sabdariffa]|uniref:Uncharacterized protein n=1 Tax=Hibiscus sabdariffa TaxID=183260 RepID=A0ABR2ENF1_9ROSI
MNAFISLIKGPILVSLKFLLVIIVCNGLAQENPTNSFADNCGVSADDNCGVSLSSTSVSQSQKYILSSSQEKLSSSSFPFASHESRVPVSSSSIICQDSLVSLDNQHGRVSSSPVSPKLCGRTIHLIPWRPQHLSCLQIPTTTNSTSSKATTEILHRRFRRQVMGRAVDFR